MRTGFEKSVNGMERTIEQEIENGRFSGFKTQRGEYVGRCGFHCSSILTMATELSSTKYFE